MCREDYPAATQISSRGTPLKRAWKDATLLVECARMLRGEGRPALIRQRNSVTHPVRNSELRCGKSTAASTKTHQQLLRFSPKSEKVHIYFQSSDRTEYVKPFILTWSKGRRMERVKRDHGSSGRTKMGIGTTPAMQRVPPPIRRTDTRSGLQHPLPQSELLSWQKVVCEVQNSQNVNCSQGEELSCPNPARWSALEDHAPACHWCVNEPVIDGESHLFWLHSGEKWGLAILRGCESNCATPWLGEWLVLWSRSSAISSTKGTASWGATLEATQGRLQPCGLGACDKCSQRHDGLAWSGPNMRWNRKYGQEPDGPAFEQNPSEPPKHSSWCLFWGQEHECGGVTTHSLPGMGQNEPIVQVVEHTNALEPQRGQSSIHAFCEHPLRQGQAKGKNLVLVSFPSKSKLKELPVPLDDLNVKIGILEVDSDKPVSLSNLRQ